MPGKSEKNSSFIDTYLSKSKESKQEEKMEMTGEHHQDTPNSTGEERTFTYINSWDEEIVMREKKIPLTLKIKQGGEEKEITKTYTFVFSPGGWELWQRKKALLIKGLQKTLAIAEQGNLPVRDVYVLKQALSAAPKEKRTENDYYYTIVIRLKKKDSPYLEEQYDYDTKERMEQEFRRWRNRELEQEDMELSDNLAIDSSFGDADASICNSL